MRRASWAEKVPPLTGPGSGCCDGFPSVLWEACDSPGRAVQSGPGRSRVALRGELQLQAAGNGCAILRAARPKVKENRARAQDRARAMWSPARPPLARPPLVGVGPAGDVARDARVADVAGARPLGVHPAVLLRELPGALAARALVAHPAAADRLDRDVWYCTDWALSEAWRWAPSRGGCRGSRRNSPRRGLSPRGRGWRRCRPPRRRCGSWRTSARWPTAPARRRSRRPPA